MLDVLNPAISYNKGTRTFSMEVSSINNFENVGRNLQVYNPTTGNVVDMMLYQTDKDASGEDIYGWRYKGVGSDNLPFYFLVIND